MKVPWSLRIDTQPSPLRDCSLLRPGAPPRPPQAPPFLVSHPTPRAERGLRKGFQHPAPGYSRGHREVPTLLPGDTRGPQWRSLAGAPGTGAP